jgi:hypothetical protein
MTSLLSQLAGPGAVSLTWSNSAAGLVPQQTSVIGSTTWTTLTNAVLLDGSGNNQLTIPAQAGAAFFRLATP